MSKEKDPYRFFIQSAEFDEVNVRIGETQDEVNTLPACFNQQTGAMIFCFQLSGEQLAKIAETGKIWFEQYTNGNNFQPIRVTAQKEDFTFPTSFEQPEVVLIYSPNMEASMEFCMKVIGQRSYRIVDYDGQILDLLIPRSTEVVILQEAEPNMLTSMFLNKHKVAGRIQLVTTTDPMFKIDQAAYVDLTKL